MDSPRRIGSSSVKKNKRRYCCVKDCHNREGDVGIKLYRFPSRPWEATRRLKWIVAVRRVNGDDLSRWSPNDNTRICSRHFANEEKSTIENHPGYLPTIFPPVYKKRSTAPAAQISRFNRWIHRSVALATAAPCAAEVVECGAEDASSSAISVPAEVVDDSIDAAGWDGLYLLSAAAEVHVAARSMETQTSETSSATTRFSVFICCAEGNNLSTQITHHETRDCEVQHTPNVASKHSGPDHRTSYFAGYESVSKSTSALEDLCNVSRAVFALLLSVFPVSTERKCDVSKEDRLLLFLMKLKLGISYSSLATLFSISETSASRHFKSVLKTLAFATKQWIFRPPLRVIQATMPDCFKAHYPDCTMIIDCTEIRTEQPPTVQQQRTLYSQYKGGYTLKFLVGVTPGGMICFHSDAYGGRVSDTHITVNSGFLDVIEAGDKILADKGFPGIRTVMGERNAVLVMPPFLQGPQFSAQEVRDTYDIAQVRIHVERMIQRIKVHNIFNNRVPTEMIPLMTDVFHVCCVLANLQPPIIKCK